MKYLIVSPPYQHNSGGIRVLYELSKHLKEAGQEAKVVQAVLQPSIVFLKKGYDYADMDYFNDATNNGCVVYPEIIHGNPTKAKRVWRYILNVPGKICGDRAYPESETLVYHNDQLKEYGKYRLQLNPTEGIFKNLGLERDADRFWVGKGGNIPKVKETEGIEEITYGYPPTREGLVRILNRTKTFYSYDDMTSLMDEAEYCGCKVKLIKKDGIIDFKSTLKEDTKNFKEELKEVIKATGGEIK